MLVIIGCGNKSFRRRRGVGRSVSLSGAACPRACAWSTPAPADGCDIPPGGHARDPIDAARQAAPGTIYNAGELAALPPPTNLTLHNFRWEHALAVGRMITRSAS
jgi:hypothetical protein